MWRSPRAGLVVALLLGLAALSLTFTVTLDSLAARNAQEAALAEGQAEGALELAAEAVRGSTAATGVAGPLVPPQDLGPWPDDGVPVEVEVVVDPEGAYRLETRARVGRSSVRRVVTLDDTAAGGIAVRARP